ncbi:MAG: hypothetical protein ACOH2K_12465, partial [Burkholderiaceae bacterium]
LFAAPKRAYYAAFAAFGQHFNQYFNQYLSTFFSPHRARLNSLHATSVDFSTDLFPLSLPALFPASQQEPNYSKRCRSLARGFNEEFHTSLKKLILPLHISN